MAAICLLTDSDSGRVLQVDDTVNSGLADTPSVLEVLKSKHPPLQPFLRLIPYLFSGQSPLMYTQLYMRPLMLVVPNCSPAYIWGGLSLWH